MVFLVFGHGGPCVWSWLCWLFVIMVPLVGNAVGWSLVMVVLDVSIVPVVGLGSAGGCSCFKFNIKI